MLPPRRSGSAPLLAALAALLLAVGEVSEVSAILSRNTYQYLQARARRKALIASEKSTVTASNCPEPANCKCHCDCPVAKFEKAPLPPPPCPVYPSYPTVAPSVKKPKKEVVKTVAVKAKKKQNPVCPAGTVGRSDGSCQPIDESVIVELKNIVLGKHEKLEETQHEFTELATSGCKNCSPKKEQMRKQLLLRHEQYRKALDLLLGALAMLPKSEVKEKTVEEKLGPEFGEAPLLMADENNLSTRRPHCEVWGAKNTTFSLDRDDCAVMCRNQPTCIGFAQEEKDGHCVWFDKKKDDDNEQQCSELKQPQYLKKRTVDLNNDIFKQMEMIHGLQELLDTTLLDSDTKSVAASHGFGHWAEKDLGEASDKDLADFVGLKGVYQGSLTDAKLVYFQLKDAVNALIVTLQKEKLKQPPFSVTLMTFVRKKKKKPLVLKKEEKPVPLNWSEFPNSKDSKWAARHPECPQGPPCFCDCQCRGVPPQNFVEPPPPPPVPCPPPPPTPPPTALSMPMGAPPALPLR